jgi:hypothetical protein
MNVTLQSFVSHGRFRLVNAIGRCQLDLTARWAWVWRPASGARIIAGYASLKETPWPHSRCFRPAAHPDADGVSTTNRFRDHRDAEVFRPLPN